MSDAASVESPVSTYPAGPKIITLGRIGSTDGRLDDQDQLVTLLAYLAHCGPTDRTTLATLFWPEARAPLNSLSSALTRIRRLLPDVLVTEGRLVSTTCHTDALAVLDAIERVSPGAHDEYPGPFLSGVQLKSLGIELEEWIFETRDAIADAVATSAIRMLEYVLTDGPVDRAAELAQRAVDTAASPYLLLDKIEVLYPALVVAGKPGATRLLTIAEEAGMPPPIMPSSGRPVPPHPIPTDGLIGRSDDTDRILSALRSSSVVNLFGIGGVGKSRLADRLTGIWPGPSIRLELVAEDDGERLLSSLAERLDAAIPAATTIDAIRERVTEPTLAVIDDVVGSTSLLEVLAELAAVEDLQLLVLSRLRLSGSSIQAVPLRGLPVHTADGEPGPAVDLFRELANAAVVERDIDNFDTDATAICSLLSGLPLAIELTAAWLRLIPVADVRTMLEGAEILEEAPPGEDLSLSRIIEQSWSLLPENAKEALSALAVLHGSFDRESASAICGIGIRELTDLHDHSLLDATPDGRLRCHALVRAFALRRLVATPERRATLENQHCTWYLDRLVTLAQGITGPDAGARLRQLQLEQPNIEAAWAHALARNEHDVLARSLPAIDDALLRSGQCFVAQRLYTTSLRSLAPQGDPIDPSLAAALANNLAWVEMLLGDTDNAALRCAQGLDWIEAHDVATHIALLRTQCALAGNDGHGAAALEGYTTAKELASSLDDPRLSALIDEDIGRAHAMLGEHEPAIAAFRRTLDAARTLGDPHMEARSYLLIGLSHSIADPTHALVLFDEGEQIADHHELRHLAAYFPIDRAHALLALERWSDAATEFERGTMLSHDVGDRVLEVAAQLGAARAHLRAGSIDDGRRLLGVGLRASIRSKQWPAALGAALAVSQLARQSDEQAADAQRLWDLAAAQPNVAGPDRELFGLAHHVGSTSPTPDLRLDELCELTLRVANTL